MHYLTYHLHYLTYHLQEDHVMVCITKKAFTNVTSTRPSWGLGLGTRLPDYFSLLDWTIYWTLIFLSLRMPDVRIIGYAPLATICDLLGIVEFLAWMDSPLCVEYNGKSFKKKDDHRPSYDQFWVLGS